MQTRVSEILTRVNDSSIGNEIREPLSILLSAINDWPEPLVSLEEFDAEVKEFIQGRVTSDQISRSLKKLDWGKDAWRGESITQVAELFKYFDGALSLTEIIERLKERLGYPSGL